MRKFIIGLILVMVSVGFADINVKDIRDQTVRPERDLAILLRKAFNQHNIDIAAMGGFGNRGTGKVFYVDSNAGGSSTSVGTTPASAVPTIDDGINLCTAGRGDWIYVMQGHTESFTAADDADADVSGVTIWGLGNGDLMPTISYTASGEFVLGADGDNTIVMGIRFIATADSVVKAIDVEAGCVGWAILNCIFEAETTTTDEFDDVIIVGAASDRGAIAGNTFRGDPGTNAEPQSCINFVDSDYLQILCNTAFGDRAIACIQNESTASNFITIRHNTLFNGIIGGTAGLNTEPCIELVATTTGVIDKNILFCNVATPEAAIVGADMMLGENFYSEVESSSPLPMGWTTDSLQNKIGVDDSSNLGTTSNVTADSDGSILERLEQIDVDTSAVLVDTAEVQQTNGVRTISKSLASIASGANNIFAVAGGPIKVVEFSLYIDTNFAATGCLIGGLVDPTTPASDTVFGTDGTAFEFNNAQAGTLILWNGVLANDFTAVVNGVALSTNTAEGMIVPVGMIELTATATNAGTATVYISYVALSEGVTVTAQ